MRPESLALGDVLHVIAVQLAWFQAAVLGAAAIHKVTHWEHTLSVVRRFAGVPAFLAPVAGVAAVAMELTAGLLLLSQDSRAAGAAAAVLLWSVYLALLLRSVWLGTLDVDCGCSFGRGHRALGAFQVGRNALLVALALLVGSDALRAGGIEPSQGPTFCAALAGIAMLALYAALDQVMALRPLRSGEVR